MNNDTNIRNSSVARSLMALAALATLQSFAFAQNGKGDLSYMDNSVSVPISYEIGTGKVSYPTQGSGMAEGNVFIMGSGPVMLPSAPPAYGMLTEQDTHPDGEDGPSIGDIFGSDDRTQITSTSSYPWSTQCDLTITWSDGSTSGGSGTVIGTKYVITAGHCVYSQTKGWASSIAVVPGRNGGTKPFGTYYASNLLSWTGWTGSGNSDDDMGVIRLSTTCSGSTGTLGLAAWSDNDGKTLNLAGYPGDKGGTTLWYDSDPCNIQTTNRLYYRVDTESGQSGSGVYRIVSGSRYVVAAHSGWNYYWSKKYNRGTRVTSGKFDDIVDWM